MSDTSETDDLARGNHVVPTEWAQQLERERDEARIDAKKSKAYKRVLKVANANLKRERDEALSQIVQAECRAEKFCQERDEAREALMKIEDLFIDGTDIYADRENMGLIARSALEEAK